MLSFAPKESPDVLRRLRSAAQRVLADEHGLGDAVATVASIPCREPGCPPFETFVQILSDVLPVAFRLNKRPADDCTAPLSPSHGEFCAYGIDALLTYHYLVSEFFMVAPMDLTHARFFAKSKRAGDLVWDGLFVRRTPLSRPASAC
ncbi:hypothetical protein SO694_00050166 [Aureococcus anophagefferens]|uniref:Uncharacterized protein n=1 Tax=Aureococcus anophagefferens TaxID=44056 RepID=A0ABR1FYZ6_AURAN